MTSVLHCETNPELSEIAAHNFKVLGQENIECISGDGIGFLKGSTQHFDWIYIDPSRRNDKKGKVFLLGDCLPNLPVHLPLLFEKAQNILVKTSPLLDIKKGIGELDFVKEVHVVATDNEVKELLFVLQKGYSGNINIKTVNIRPSQTDTFSFSLEEEPRINIEFGEPGAYLFEPNAAIMKSGGFKSVAKTFGLKKLHQHSHLYTGDHPMDFPGRGFKIDRALPYSKKTIKSMGVAKANVTTRNFPVSVSELRKKHKIKDGGDRYLFFTKDLEENLIVLVCSKV